MKKPHSNTQKSSFKNNINQNNTCSFGPSESLSLKLLNILLPGKEKDGFHELHALSLYSWAFLARYFSNSFSMKLD